MSDFRRNFFAVLFPIQFDNRIRIITGNDLMKGIKNIIFGNKIKTAKKNS